MCDSQISVGRKKLWSYPELLEDSALKWMVTNWWPHIQIKHSFLFYQMCAFIKNFLLIIQRSPRTAHMCPLQGMPTYAIHAHNHLQINQPDGFIVLHNVT